MLMFQLLITVRRKVVGGIAGGGFEEHVVIGSLPYFFPVVVCSFRGTLFTIMSHRLTIKTTKLLTPMNIHKTRDADTATFNSSPIGQREFISLQSISKILTLFSIIPHSNKLFC